MNGQPEPFGETISSLENILAELRVKEEELRRTLLAQQDQIRRATRALEILSERERKTKTPKRPDQSNHHWQPRRENVEKVYAAVLEGHQTTTELATAINMSRSTVQKSLDVLRSEERVRKTGVTQAGNSNQKIPTYAAMPQPMEIEDYAA